MYYPFVRKALFQLDPDALMSLLFSNYAALPERRLKPGAAESACETC